MPMPSPGTRSTLRRRLARWLAAAWLATALPLAVAGEAVHYHWFDYQGEDAAFARPAAPGRYHNPVLAGFHPDPSVVRVGARYYLVTSSFAYFPGLPVFESADLVHWRQIGNVIDRPGQMDFDGLGVSRGLYAADISHHAGTWYVVGTLVDGGGNFIVSAKDPAGPWSDPVWLTGVDGIDPALFIDADGSAWLLNNGPPEGEPLYAGHRAIWMQQFDLAGLRPVGPRRVLVNGGRDLAARPVWIEGPHLYRHAGWYVLSCAEGGTGPEHSQVVFRSRSRWGPYLPAKHNPILTQRDLPAGRAEPVVNAGHADLVQAADGSWWALFLASRAWGGMHYATGRETWLLPVRWEDGWPRILDAGQVIPRRPALPAFAPVARPGGQAPLSGNFHWRDEFDGPRLDPAWLQLRAPRTAWADLAARPGTLTLHAQDAGLDSRHNPSFLARRQQHLVFDASTALEPPADADTLAGLAAFQNETHWFVLGAQRRGADLEISLRRRDGADERVLARRQVRPGATLKLRIRGAEGRYGFAFDADGQGWRWLRTEVDARLLGSDVAGGFTGAVLGPFARSGLPAVVPDLAGRETEGERDGDD